MTARSHLLERLRAALDRDAATDLLRRAVATPSVTGEEGAMVAFLREEMERLRLAPEVYEAAPGRPNLAGRRGAGGPHLLFMGHTDTVRPGDWAERWAGAPQADPFGGAVIEGELWGRGAADLKAGICAGLSALDLVERAGLSLKGSVSFAFVADEESGEPGMGVSAGARRHAERVLAGELPRPDFAIYVEPSRLQVFPVQIGFLIAEIRIAGRSAYFGRPELGLDALKAGHAVLSSLWEHDRALQDLPSHPLLGRASLLVTGVRSGGLIAVPGECRIELIRKLLPGEALSEAAQAIEATVRRAVPEGLGVDIAWPAGRDHPLGGSAAGIPADHPAVALLSGCLGAVRPGAGTIEGAPFWSEMPFLVDRIGCPAVYCAPGDIALCHTHEERVPLAEYHDAILAFATFIAEFCGTEGGTSAANMGEPT